MLEFITKLESPPHAASMDGDEMDTVPRPVEEGPVERTTMESAAAEGKSNPTVSHEIAEVTLQKAGTVS